MRALLSVSFAIVAGLMMTRVIKKFHLPAVTAYLLAGLAIGPYAIGRFNLPIGFNTMEQLSGLSILSECALGFIAFAIGNEFRLSSLKATGRQATIVGIVQGIVAAFFVDAALIGLHFILGEDKLSLSSAITLGAIATATAPAATLMVVRQYKAKGKLTDILLPVVALDDAVGLVVFAVSFGIARALKSGSVDLISILVEPVIEIVLSLVFGAFMGALLTWVEKLFNSNSNRLSLTIAFVLLTVAISLVEFDIGSVHFGFSSLLVCMMMGTIFCNICPLSEDLMDKSDKWTAPLYVLFFVMSGAELELNVFSDIAVIGIGLVYILFRSLGKYFGAMGSCKWSGCDDTVTKYLGITLLPQAGVALGMCQTAGSLGGYDGTLIRNIILFSVLIYELIGPAMTKWALTKAGDIQPMSNEVINRRETKLQQAAENRQKIIEGK